MRVGFLRIFGTFVAVLTLFLFFVMTQQGFVPFEYAKYSVNETMIPFNEEIGEAISNTLWNQRQLDMLVLAFLLFVSAACCATILRTEKSDQR